MLLVGCLTRHIMGHFRDDIVAYRSTVAKVNTKLVCLSRLLVVVCHGC